MKPIRLILTAAALLCISLDTIHGDELRLIGRYREQTAEKAFLAREKQLVWSPRETAVIVVDMWNNHWCTTSAQRTGELAPVVNRFVSVARERGALVIHSPSDCMKFYADHAGRKLAQTAKAAKNLPEDISAWCSSTPSEREGQYPIDQSDGGCEAKPTPAFFLAWSRQHPAIEIKDGDAVSDSGVEVWNLLEERGITNVLLLGVHTNMCVLGRPFGLRNLSRYGKNVVLVRDLTDTMYNPESWPYVNHFRGNELIAEHIEKYVCPTITSNQLLGGEAFRFEENQPPHIVVAISEDVYHTDETLRRLAHELFENEFGYRVSVLTPQSEDRAVLPNFAAEMETADAFVLSMRRRALPEKDLAAVREYLRRGKPLLAIRTSSHAFDAKENVPDGHAEWTTFGKDVLGCNYQSHYDDGPQAKIQSVESSSGHPILRGVRPTFVSLGALYKSRPLVGSTKLLLTGEIPGQPVEPVAWTNRVGESRIFYTSLGHAEDFKNPNFTRLLGNALRWSIEAPPELTVDDFKSWRSVQVPDPWEVQSAGALASYDGHGWLRCYVNIPADWKQQELGLSLGRIDDCDQTYWNGERVGSTGKMPGQGYESARAGDRAYKIPATAVQPGAWNTLAVHIFDHDGEGGLISGQPAVRRGEQVIRLAGRWELRIGNDTSWASETAPANPAEGARFNRVEKIETPLAVGK